MRLISTSDDKTMMYVECDGTELTIGESMTVDREKLITLLEALDSETITLSRYLLRPKIIRTDLEPMDTLLIRGEGGRGFILAPIE